MKHLFIINPAAGKYDHTEEVKAKMAALKEASKALEDAKAEGQQETLVSSIKNLMDSLDMTIDKAMESLKIPQADRAIYAGLLENS